MTLPESWKFTGLNLLALLWHRDRRGRSRIHWLTILGTAAALAATALIPGTGSLIPAALVIGIPAGLWLADWSGLFHPRYLSADRRAALIVRSGPQGWRPDGHLKAPGTPAADVSEFRIRAMTALLPDANEHGITITLNPRDDGLFRRYAAELVTAQDRLGIPAGHRRTLVKGRKRWRGHDYVCAPA
jgi:hypothetical protein